MPCGNASRRLPGGANIGVPRLVSWPGYRDGPGGGRPGRGVGDMMLLSSLVTVTRA